MGCLIYGCSLASVLFWNSLHLFDVCLIGVSCFHSCSYDWMRLTHEITVITPMVIQRRGVVTLQAPPSTTRTHYISSSVYNSGFNRVFH